MQASCADGIAQQTSGSLAKNLASAHLAEQKFFAAEKREEQGIFSIFDKVLEAERKLLAIEVGGKLYYPTCAYIATSITNKYECRMVYADDTIHVREGAPYVAVPIKASDKVDLVTAWTNGDIESLNVYAGHSGEMHQNGYKNVQQLPIARPFTTLTYKPVGAVQPNLMFAIVKVKGDKLFRKFVFILANN